MKIRVHTHTFTQLWISVLILLMTGMMAGFAHAQEEDVPPCSAGGISERVADAIRLYELTSVTNRDTIAALDSLEALRDDLDAIYDECSVIREEIMIDDAAETLALLREGGYVVYMRHGITNRMEEDASLESCETQRNLNAEGRETSAFIGEIFPTLDIPLGTLISTEYCRTIETAELAFGTPEIIPRAELEDNLLEILSIVPEDGTNTFIVAHVGSIGSVMTIPDTFNEGDALVFLPDGEGGAAFIARIALDDWWRFAEIAERE